MSRPRIAFAGDREIAVRVLEFLLDQQVRPRVLLVSDPAVASHAEELRSRCGYLPDSHVLEGTSFRSPDGLERLGGADLEWLICVHFPYYMPREVLRTARNGALNLHPGMLPYTRGWHTPSWAILEDTPMGATLHFMTEEIDAGDIVCQREVTVGPGDTAHTLYARTLELELDVFRDAWPHLVSGTVRGMSQPAGAGTVHRRDELLAPEIQRIDLDARVRAGDLLRRLRALTTNRLEEAAWYEVEGRRYRVQLQITEEAG